jgi:hypothetical protein
MQHYHVSQPNLNCFKKVQYEILKHNSKENSINLKSLSYKPDFTERRILLKIKILLWLALIGLNSAAQEKPKRDHIFGLLFNLNYNFDNLKTTPRLNYDYKPAEKYERTSMKEMKYNNISVGVNYMQSFKHRPKLYWIINYAVNHQNYESIYEYKYTIINYLDATDLFKENLNFTEFKAAYGLGYAIPLDQNKKLSIIPQVLLFTATSDDYRYIYKQFQGDWKTWETQSESDYSVGLTSRININYRFSKHFGVGIFSDDLLRIFFMEGYSDYYDPGFYPSGWKVELNMIQRPRIYALITF